MATTVLNNNEVLVSKDQAGLDGTLRRGQRGLRCLDSIEV